ncbi:unnamed protein product, partial [Rotaria magnacalcarata]
QKTYHPALKSVIHSERSKSPANDNPNSSIEHEFHRSEPTSPLSNSNSTDQSSPDTIINGIDMK